MTRQSDSELTDDPARQHRWQRLDGGDVDIFAHNPYDPHNGPLCERCGEGFCHHCEPDCYRYVCPSAAVPSDRSDICAVPTGGRSAP